MTQQKKAIIASVVGYSIFGFSFMFSKIALRVLSPFTLLAVRFLVAFLSMSMLILFKVVKVDLKGKDYKGILALGIVQPILYFSFENYGIALTNSVISGALIGLVPVAGLLLGMIFMKERFNLFQLLCTGVSIAGIILISISGQKDGSATVLGIILLIGAVMATAAFNLLSRKISNIFTAFERTYVMFAMGSLFFWCMAWLNDREGFLWELESAITDASVIGAIIYLGLISSVLAFLLLNYAMNDLPVGKASSFANLTTVVSMAAGAFFLGESISVMHFIGCILVLVSVYGVNRVGKKR